MTHRRRNEYRPCSQGMAILREINAIRITRNGLVRLKFSEEQRVKLDILQRRYGDHKRSCDKCQL